MTANALRSAGETLLQRMKLDSLLITRGRHGMVAFERGRQAGEIPIYGSDQVVDVTGAGDTVIAAFTAALAAGGFDRRGGAARQLRRRHRGDEARNGHGDARRAECTQSRGAVDLG